MPKKKPTVQRARGASRMYQLGNKCVAFWLDPVELQMVKAAFAHGSIASAAKHQLMEGCHERGQYRHMYYKPEKVAK